MSLLMLFSAGLFAQTYYPGGFGSDDLIFHYDADKLVTDGPPVTDWGDIGPNNINAVVNGGDEPDFSAVAINGLPALSFTGADRVRLASNSLINSGGPYSEKQITIILQTGADVSTRQVVYEQGGGGGTGKGLNIFIENDSIFLSVWADNAASFQKIGLDIIANTPYVLTYFYDAVSIGFVGYLNGVAFGLTSPVNPIQGNANGVAFGGINGNTRFDGVTVISGTGDRFIGDFGEIVYYNDASEAKRIILENYYSEKFSRAIVGDFFSLPANNQLIGIALSVGSTVDSAGNDGLIIQDAGFLVDNNDIMLVGHNIGSGTSLIGSDVFMNRSWDVELTDNSANGGNVTLLFDLDYFDGANYLVSSNFYLRVNGAQTMVGGGTLVDGVLSFTLDAVTIDGATITIGNTDFNAVNPEVCDDGLDNDRDGLIDCFDDDCIGISGCDSFYYNRPTPACQFTPGSTPVSFNLELIFKTDKSIYPIQQRSGVYVGDMDSDGVPDMIAKQPDSAGVGVINIFDGRDGSLKQSISQSNEAGSFAQVALADVDKDGLGDIFTVENGGTNLYRYEYNTVGPVWVSDGSAGSNNAPPGIADFDKDGIPEIFVEDRIFSSSTGTRLVVGTGNQGRNSGSDAMPVAFNVFNPGDAKPGGGTFGIEALGLEFIAGNEVYVVELGNGTLDNGSMTLVSTLAGFSDGFTSIADLNGDNKTDIVVTADGEVFAWDPYTQLQIGSTHVLTGTSAGGRCNIGDFDNDNEVEIGVAGNDYYVVLEYNSGGGTLDVLWEKTGLNDGSERTGSTLFDFEGDGTAEVVYQDQDRLYVWRGSDGFELSSIVSGAGTRIEYPLVADVDADGQAEIVVAAQDETSPGDHSGYVAVYRASSIPWITARQVWNQHAFFNTNVNDDLTIPKEQQNHTEAAFSGHFNNFLTQTTLTTSTGQPANAAPNPAITIQDASVPGNDVDLSLCGAPDSQLIFDLTISNSGDEVLSNGTPISYYNGNPFNSAATFIKKTDLGSFVNSGGSVTITDTIDDQNGDAFDLYIIVNHDGSVAATPLTGFTTTVGDCDTTDNLLIISLPGCIGAVDDVSVTFEGIPAIVQVTSNDTRPSGESLQITVSQDGVNGSSAVNNDTTLIYFPDAEYFGFDTVYYSVCLQSAPTVCDTAKVVITVQNVNDPPVAQDDNLVINEDVQGVGDLSTNDSDPDGDALVYTETPSIAPTNGSVVINPSGAYTYTPDLNFSGSDSFEYEVKDSGIPTFTRYATVSITVNAINDGAEAVDDAFSGNEDDDLSGDVSTNDFDAEGNNITYNTTLVTDPTNGTIIFNTAGAFTFTPDPNFFGVVSFEYEVCDDGIPVGCDTGLVTLTINSVNDAPVADPDSYVINEDEVLNDDISINDADLELNNLTYNTTLVSAPTLGGVTLLANGTFTYTPTLNANGSDSFIYEVCDDGTPIECDTALVSISIISINDQPIAVNDLDTTSEDITLNDDFSVNDLEVDGEDLIYTNTAVSGPSFGSVTINTSGSYSYIPNNDYVGNDTIFYEVCDDNVIPLCDTGRVIITVNAVNDEPIGNPDAYVVNEDEVLNNDVSGNDSDKEFDNLTYNTTFVSAPTLGGATLLANGNFTYTPTANANGIDSFIYEVCDDGTPSACDTALVTITILAINDQPIALNDLYNTNEDITLNDDFSLNDQEVDGENLIYSTTPVTSPSFGLVTINSTGSFAYIPNDDYVGNDTLFYEVCDDNAIPLCDTARVVITVDPINDSPVALGDTFSVAEDAVLFADVTANDTDIELDNLIYNTSAVAGPFNGGLAIAANGTFTYTPNANFNGQDGFIYQVCDDGTPSMCDTAIVVINITPVNDQPVAINDSYSTDEDITLNDDFSVNDLEVDGENLVYTGIPVTSPSFGSVTINSNGTFAYIPNDDYVGNDTLFYEVCDDNAISLCDTAQVIITVNAVNDQPVADPDLFVINEDEVLSDNVSGNDSDLELDNLIYNTTLVTTPTLGGVSLLANGTFTYTPTANANGSDSFIYEVCDDGAPNECDTALVTITIIPINDQPIAVNDLDTTNEDVTLNDDFSVNDLEVDGENLVYTTTAVSGPLFGSVTINVSGTYTYIPNNDYQGNDTISYEVCDDNAIPLCDTGIAIITIISINDAPIAVVDSFDLDEDNLLSNDLSINDSDSESNNLTYSTSAISGPTNGSVGINANGTFDYTPSADFNGIDSFEYEVCDDGNPSMCDTGLAIITVAPINDQPIAVTDSLEMDEDGTLNNILTGGDFDVDGDNLVYTTSAITDPITGLLTIDSNGDFQYTPDANFFGEITFNYEVCDDFIPALCDTASVIITVNNVNDAPDGVRDNYVINEDQGLGGNFSMNDSDIDGIDLLTYQNPALSGPSNGSVFINSNGTFSYFVTPNFNGIDSLIYRVCDNGTPSLCDTALVQITVIAQPDAPIAIDDIDTTNAGELIVIDVQNNDSEVDGEQMITSVFIDPVSGIAVLLNDDSIQYTPNNPSFVDFDTITYVVCDPGLLCDTAQVIIKIGEDQFAPLAVDDTVVLNEDDSVFSFPLDNDVELNTDDTLSLSAIIVTASNGLAIILNDSIRYTPSADFNGFDSISYEVCDLTALCDTAWIRFEVFDVNDAPIISDGIGQPIDSLSLIVSENGFIEVNVDATDIDGNALDVEGVIITGSLNGVVSDVGTGDTSFIYTPNADFVGMDTLDVVVCDNGAPQLCDTVTVVFTVTSSNQPPIANDDATSTNPSTSFTYDVQNNDFDPDGDILVTTIIVDPKRGLANVVNSDSITYTSGGAFTSGSDTLTYVVCDPDGACDTAIFVIFVDPGELPPEALDDFEVVDEDVTSYFKVLDNDSDANGDPLIITSILAGPFNGASVIVNDSLEYIPSANFFGQDSIQYSVCDITNPTPLCDDAWVIITVNDVNDRPIIVNGIGQPTDTLSFIVGKNEFIEVNIDAIDIDGNALDVDGVITTGSFNGVVSDVGTGDTSFTYTPNADFVGIDILDVVVCDNGAPQLCDTVTIVFTVTSSNQAPIANDDATTTNPSTSFTYDVQNNDFDPDGDILVTTIISDPKRGLANVVNADSITYTSGGAFTSGSDTLTYVVCDSEGACDTAIFVVFVDPGELAPIASNDFVVVVEDETSYFEVLDNDIDANDDQLIVTSILAGPFNGVSVIVGDSIEYIPTTNFFGQDSLQYSVCDTTSPTPLCDEAWVFITVDNVNDAPVITESGLPVNQLLVSVDENDSIIITLEVSEVDGDAIDVVALISGPSSGLISGLSDNDTAFKYVPNTQYNGFDTVSVVLCDDGIPVLCDTVEVVFTINSTNQSPIANADFSSTNPSVGVNIDVQNNDVDPDGDALTTSIISGPNLGTANVINGDSISYTPDLAFTSGTDTLSYAICDLEGACDTAFVVISVSEVEHTPVASDDIVAIEEDVTSYFNVLDNDTDANNDPLNITSILAGPFNGTSVIINDSIEYIPTLNFFGQDSIQYLVCDTTSPTPLCDEAWVLITVNNVNDAPVITESGLPVNQLSVSVDENDSIIVTLEVSEVDGDAIDVVALISGPSSGLISGLSDNDTAFKYVPNTQYNGFDTVSVVLCDDGIPVLCDTVEVVFTINSTNQSPIANADFSSTNPSVGVNIDVQNNDVDPDGDALTTSIISGPSLGTANVINGDSISYTPDLAFTSGTDTLSYAICDPEGACDTTIIVIFMSPGQLAPVAVNDSLIVNEGETAFADVLFNDVDPNGDSLTLLSVSLAPIHGLFIIENNQIRYSASSDFNGFDSLNYVVCDTSSPTALCDTATLYIRVTPVNDAPEFIDSLGASIDSVFAITNEDQAVFIQFYGTDVDNDTLDIVAIVSGGLNGIVTGLSDGDTAVTFTPNGGFSGVEHLQLVMCDQGTPTLCDTVVLQINVIPALNNAPIAANDIAATDSGVSIIIDVQFNDIDPDGDSMITSIISDATNGTVIVIQGDSIEYTPNAGFTLGTDTLTYAVCDADLACDTAMVVIFVPSGPLAPVAGNDFVTLFEDDSVEVHVLLNDADPNGDLLFVSALAQLASNGNATITGDSIQYVPNLDYYGQDTISYVVCDTTSRCDTAVVIFTINPVNDAPEITDSLSVDADTIRITTSQDLTITVQAFALDIDSDTLTLSVISGPSNGTIEGLISDSMRFEYSPNIAYTGFDSIRYVVCDNGSPEMCDTAMLIIELFQVIINNTPNAEPDFIATDPSVNVIVDVQANDTEPDGEEMITTISVNPSNGVATVLNGDSISYTPNIGFDTGTDTLFYSVCDTNGACDTAMVVIFVPNSPYPPKGVDDYVTILEEEQVFIKVLFNDSDPNGDPITINSIITPPSHGQIISLGDSMRYTPVNNFFGQDFYDYRVCDNLFLCDTARVFITVENVNDAPNILDSIGGDLDSISFTTRMNIPVEVTLLVQDYDPDVVEVTNVLNGPANGTVLGLGDGNTNFQFWPDTSFIGVDTFLVMVCDNGTPQLCDSVNIIVSVEEGNNSAPNAEDDLVTADAGIEKIIDVQFNDSDPEGDFFITTIISGPSHGTALVLNKDSISYTADSSFTLGVDTMQYSICDPGLLCDTAFLIIFVPDADLAPVVTGETVVVLEDDSISVAVLANDFDPNIDTIHVSNIVIGPVNGIATLQSDTIKYIPNHNFFGQDSLSYFVCDDVPLCDTAWLIFEVTPVDDAPIAINDSISTENSIPVEFDVANNDIDLDGDVDLSLISIIDDANNGTVSVLDSGVVLYEPFLGFIGTDEFTYSYCDSISCDTATVFVTVKAFDGFFISEGVSPNGDGANDFLVIRGIENYPDNVVTIMNRWGNVVYEQEGYNRFDETKVWKGLSNSGKELTDGTYYYIVKLNDSDGTVHTGFVLLSKTN